MPDQRADAAPRGRAPSLAEWLRRRTDQQLIDLLAARPDVALPAPADIATLASRVGVRSSVHRAVDGLDAFRLRVLDALVLAADGHVASLPRLLDWLPATPVDDVRRALDSLRALALVWGEDDALHLVASVADAVGAYPAGLGRPAARLLPTLSDVTLAPVLRGLGLPPATQPRSGDAVLRVLATPDRVGGLVAASSPAERDVLDRLAAGPPIGTVRDAVVPTAADAATPPLRLVARGLLLPVDAQTVELPREVGLALRGPEPLGAVSPAAPPIAVVERAADELDRLGATAVLDTLRLVEALGDEWAHRPVPSLRSGGIGIRELRRTARAVGVGEDVAALLVETAAAAGLVASRSGMEPAFLPTTDYDGWRQRSPGERWLALAGAWLTMTRQPSLIGLRDERDRLITALGPDAERGTIPAVRRAALGALTSLEPGTAPADRSAVFERLAWLAPRRAQGQRPMVVATLDEADHLGLTAAGGLTRYGRAVLAGARSAAVDAVAAALPPPVDDFLIQPDLTVVVPGPPTADLARELGLAADLESTGGANVYRVTESTIRRALDAGRSGAELAQLFAGRSRTPVPQALTYLVDDIARRHGVLRTGAAAAYLRCDDESLLSRVLADRSIAGLELRRIAPTVVVSPAPVARVLDELRAAGYAPSGEGADGGVLRLDEHPARVTSRPTSRIARVRPPADSTQHLAELVDRLRSGDQVSELSRRVRPTGPRIPGVTTAATLALLREAIRTNQTIWLGYVDGHGSGSQHTIAPISLGGGVVRGIDATSGRLESFALHHVTGVGVVEPDAPPAESG